MTETKVFLFDLGNVLMGWDPHRVFNKLLPDAQEREVFIKRFMDYNAERDRTSWVDAAPFLDEPNPSYRPLYQIYADHYVDSLIAPIDGTVEILKKVKAAGLKAYAASNWASDTFESARPHMPFLSLFDDMQISGHVGLIKPHADFFERMMKVFGFQAEESLFIDDSAANVEAAKKLGIPSILFTSPTQLERELRANSATARVFEA